ncbi:alpha/beta fold hydrolase [Arenimonas caeni]|jgi:haloalkane dehalogenase|uniref:Alpha/beta hydrolase n=1 Tax=Arenimonas caeni TaxID=2058085 RepID=A0A2P6M954_9GAMM|nr:alpha/beta fold hydrolase [Arenimonas caeni]MDY0021914.1 alpha/beta fold hydrolase [Arenimonas caeni]PRH82516.1 alpha/beta hydrolase [Arenimonas caeni]
MENTTPSAEQARVLAKGPFPDYPFTPKSFRHPNGLVQSYLDEGQGETVLMLHGNPSWSYYWRKLVLGLRDGYRCIVPDHVGMGLSDKPDDKGYQYTLRSRIQDLDRLLSHAGAGDDLTLAVHDWGGMIGFGWALKHGARIRRLVILNTASFPLPASKPMPWQLKLGRDYNLGALAIRGFNAFAAGATRQGVAHKMPADVQRAYEAPYDSWKNRISTLRFVQDIPLQPGDRAWDLVEDAGKRLPEYADRPAFIGWGLRDFVFDHHFLKGFTQALPKAEVHAFEDAGHYVLEDKADTLVPAIRAFLERNPL